MLTRVKDIAHLRYEHAPQYDVFFYVDGNIVNNASTPCVVGTQSISSAFHR
jgi:hypothetical protein